MRTEDEARMDVLAHQEARVLGYTEFEAGFIEYLNGGDETNYTQMCTSVTAKFKEASESVNRCEEELRAMGAEKLCGWIRKLQEGEKEKLHLSIALQVERKRARQMADQRSNRAKDLPEEASEAIQEEEDFVAEVQGNKLVWLKGQVDEAVVKINEALDEIRYWEG